MKPSERIEKAIEDKHGQFFKEYGKLPVCFLRDYIKGTREEEIVEILDEQHEEIKKFKFWRSIDEEVLSVHKKMLSEKGGRDKFKQECHLKDGDKVIDVRNDEEFKFDFSRDKWVVPYLMKK